MSLLDKALAKRGLTRDDLKLESTKTLGERLYTDGVPNSKELQRVLALPRKTKHRHTNGTYSEMPEGFVDDLSHMLATAKGRREGVRLWDHQALVILYGHDFPGVFAELPVGAGKTLVSLVAATILGAQRPLLMVPASLRDKTKLDYAELRDYWQIKLPPMLGFEMLSHPQHAGDLDKHRPDLIAMDEVDKYANPESVGALRVRRYLMKHPDTKVVAMSGTLMGSSILRYQHILGWCLGLTNIPLPARQHDLRIWAQALDFEPKRKNRYLRRIPLGELRVFDQYGHDTHSGLDNFIADTPGVVRVETSGCPAAIRIRPWDPPLPEEVRDTIKAVSDSGMHPDPAMRDLVDEEKPRVIRALRLGYYQTMDPVPPEEWFRARRRWNRFVEETRLHPKAFEHGIDSPFQVEQAITRVEDESKLDDWQKEFRAQGQGLLVAWQVRQAEFGPVNTATYWLTKEIAENALDFARRKLGSGVIWSSSEPWGQAMRELGIPHFDEGGHDREMGEHIYTTKHKIVSASIKSCSTGFNLQSKWSKFLVVTPMGTQRAWEQLIGRFHRPGQKATDIQGWVYGSNSNSFARAVHDADYQHNMKSKPNKLTSADIVGFNGLRRNKYRHNRKQSK